MCEQRQNTQTRLETSQLYLFVVENIVKDSDLSDTVYLSYLFDTVMEYV